MKSRFESAAVNADGRVRVSGAADSFERRVAAVCEAERPRLAALFGDPHQVELVERELRLRREIHHREQTATAAAVSELRPPDGDGGGRRDGDDQDDPPGALLAGPTPARSAPAVREVRATDRPARRGKGPVLVMGGHVVGDKPEDSIVVAMIAALNGIRVNGENMAGRANGGHAATLGEVADLLAWHKSTVHRSVQRLIAAGALVAAANGLGYLVVPEVHASRWAQGRKVKLLRNDFERLEDHDELVQRRRAEAEAAHRAEHQPCTEPPEHPPMPTADARPLLLVGLLRAHTQVAAVGHLNMGMTRWSAYSGMPRRTVQRAIRDAEAAGLIRRRTTPYSVVLSPLLPSPVGALCNREQPSPVGALSNQVDVDQPSPVGTPIVPDGRTVDRPLQAHPPSPVGARKKGVQRREERDSPSEALPRPEGETESTPAAPAEHPVVTGPVPVPPRPVADLSPASPAIPRKVDPIAEVERWAIAMANKGIERMDPKRAAHFCAVAEFLEKLGGNDGVRDLALVRRERRELAASLITWCPSPERLAQWLVEVRRQFGARELARYVRRTVEKGGDPGTVLGSHLSNLYGQGAGQIQHFTPATDTALEGKHATAVAELKAEGSAAMRLDFSDREELLQSLRRMLFQGDLTSAKKILLKLVGPDRSDEAVLAAVGDAELAGRCIPLLRGVA